MDSGMETGRVKHVNLLPKVIFDHITTSDCSTVG